jgi:hypothetical protein
MALPIIWNFDLSLAALDDGLFDVETDEPREIEDIWMIESQSILSVDIDIQTRIESGRCILFGPP